MKKMKLVVVTAAVALLLSCGTERPQTVGVRKCPDWSSDPVSNYSNEDFSNHGCATSNNFYVQLKDPSHAVYGVGKSGIDTTRDGNILQGYFSGGGGGAASSDAAAGGASSASSTSR